MQQREHVTNCALGSTVRSRTTTEHYRHGLFPSHFLCPQTPWAHGTVWVEILRARRELPQQLQEGVKVGMIHWERLNWRGADRGL